MECFFLLKNFISMSTAMNKSGRGGYRFPLGHIFSFHVAVNKSSRQEKAFFPVHLPQESSGLNSVFSSVPSVFGSSDKINGGAEHTSPALAESVALYLKTIFSKFLDKSCCDLPSIHWIVILHFSTR